MEILKTRSVHKFIVKRGLMHHGKKVEPGETIEINQQSEADELIQTKKSSLISRE